jgi:hypothetical protein
MWLLKSQLDQKLLVINYKLNGDFKATSFLEGHNSDKRVTSCITLQMVYLS